MKAIGEDYILCYEKDVAEKNGLKASHRKGHYIKLVHKGNVFDFTQAKSPVLLGGIVYSTVACGVSSPRDVKGLIIRITKVYRGNATEFSKIEYDVEKST